MAKLSQKHLESDLQDLLSFDKPKVGLEQYQTPPSLAAEILHFISLTDVIKGKNVLDLGCGCGMLGFGLVRLQANFVLGVDIDDSAIAIATKNRDDVGVLPDSVSFIVKDVLKLSREDLPPNIDFDLAIMNPPFGTKDQEHADSMFVEKGLELTSTVYSIHKSSTRPYWTENVAKMWKEKYSWNVVVDVMLKDIRFRIPFVHNFHKLDKLNIKIDLIKFTR